MSLPGKRGQWVARLRRAARRLLERQPSAQPSQAYFEALMKRYQTGALVVDEAGFKQRIDKFLSLHDHEMEQLRDTQAQRDLTVSFAWGHDHDFGTFRLSGRMGTRHIRHLTEYSDRFQALPRDLTGLRVLDIGCWTGGTSLLLSAMGAQVLAIDEVRKYVDCLAYLRQAFAVENLEVRHCSLYDLADSEFQGAFDIVLFAGVLYHVTDPIVALRIIFNCLRDGGRCLVETTAYRSRKPLISYERRRWNWFDLSPSALEQMLADVGFTRIEIGEITPDDRMYAVAQRTSYVDMRRDGLSMKLRGSGSSNQKYEDHDDQPAGNRSG